MCFRILQMIGERGVGNPGSHQRYYCDNALCLYIDRFLIPYFAEEHIIIEMREHRSEFSELVSACSLYDFFSHFTFLLFIPSVLRLVFITSELRFSSFTSPMLLQLLLRLVLSPSALRFETSFMGC